ncbi:MAG TPA: hypothetical protein VF280_03190 [Burkholderiales bacterium]|jgi:hypothetical protein
MPTRRRRKSRSLAAQTVELGIAAPQVIAHRMTRMDPAEFQRMGLEKLAAAGEAWTAMAAQAFLENQKIAMSFVQSIWFPWMRPTSKSLSRQVSQATTAVLGKGLAPVRRRAVANAKRLGRIRTR